MDVTGSGSAANKATANSAAPREAAKTAINADFDTFLKLLTTQMQNQDPLQPMNSTEFVAQLASFSAVEQQIRTNDQLEGIMGALSGGNGSLAQWIGREIQAPASADFTGDPVEVGVDPVEGADSSILVVRNDFGSIVSRVQVDPGGGTVSWDGSTTSGTSAATGRYSFSLESYEGDNLLGTEPGRVFTAVEEVRVVDGSPWLVVSDGSQIPAAEVTAVR